jgi:hypothetical protein
VWCGYCIAFQHSTRERVSSDEKEESCLSLVSVRRRGRSPECTAVRGLAL